MHTVQLHVRLRGLARVRHLSRMLSSGNAPRNHRHRSLREAWNRRWGPACLSKTVRDELPADCLRFRIHCPSGRIGVAAPCGDWPACLFSAATAAWLTSLCLQLGPGVGDGDLSAEFVLESSSSSCTRGLTRRWPLGPISTLGGGTIGGGGPNICPLGGVPGSGSQFTSR